MGVDLYFKKMLKQTQEKGAFMQVLRMYVDVPFLLSLDKHNWKNMFMQTYYHSLNS